MVSLPEVSNFSWLVWRDGCALAMDSFLLEGYDGRSEGEYSMHKVAGSWSQEDMSYVDLNKASWWSFPGNVWQPNQGSASPSQRRPSCGSSALDNVCTFRLHHPRLTECWSRCLLEAAVPLQIHSCAMNTDKV